MIFGKINMGGTSSLLSTEVFRGTVINYKNFTSHPLKRTTYRLSDSISARTRSRHVPAAPPRSNALPWITLKASGTLVSYYEFYDGSRRVVLVGEYHDQVKAGDRNLKRYDKHKDHPTNQVLVKFLEAKRDSSIQTFFFLEESVVESAARLVLSGGGIFEPVTDRRTRSGVVRFGINPSFDPFVMEEPKEKLRRIYTIPYLARQLHLHHSTVVNVDVRDLFLSEFMTDLLYYPVDTFKLSNESTLEKSMDGAINRHHVSMKFCSKVMIELFDRVKLARASFEAFFRDNERITAVFDYYLSMIQQYLEQFNEMSKTDAKELRELFDDYRALDKVTVQQHTYATEMPTRLMDFYSVGKILQLPERSLTVMYAGTYHVQYIARLLMLNGTGFELDHVGVSDHSGKKFTTEPSEDSDTLRALYYAYRDYADSASRLERNAANIGVISDEEWADFTYAPNCLLFGDSGLTKRVLEFSELRVEKVT